MEGLFIRVLWYTSEQLNLLLFVTYVVSWQVYLIIVHRHVVDAIYYTTDSQITVFYASIFKAHQRAIPKCKRPKRTIGEYIGLHF